MEHQPVAIHTENDACIGQRALRNPILGQPAGRTQTSQARRTRRRWVVDHMHRARIAQDGTGQRIRNHLYLLAGPEPWHVEELLIALDIGFPVELIAKHLVIGEPYAELSGGRLRIAFEQNAANQRGGLWRFRGREPGAQADQSPKNTHALVASSYTVARAAKAT